MKLNIDVSTNFKSKEALAQVGEAAEKALRDVTVLIAADVVKGSPWLTGNNKRSIAFEAEGLAASVYGSSGYSGYLEIGSGSRPARPYFRPALDANWPKYPKLVKRYI